MQDPINQNQQLADYIKKNLAKGYTSDALKYSLMQQGYSRTSVEKALELANKQMAQKAPKMSEKPVITYSYNEEDIKRKIMEQDSQENFLVKLWRKIFK